MKNHKHSQELELRSKFKLVLKSFQNSLSSIDLTMEEILHFQSPHSQLTPSPPPLKNCDTITMPYA